MLIRITLALPLEAVTVPLARTTVSSVLDLAGIEPDCLAEVELALSEACTNALNHASGGETYEVSIALEGDWLTIDVTDSGDGFPPDSPETSMPDPLADSGRGAALITALADTAHFDSVTSTGGASVHMAKRLSWIDGAPAWSVAAG